MTRQPDPVAPQGGPGTSPSWTLIYVVGLAAGAVGLAVGASQPLARCAVVVGIICGPTEGGLLLGVAVLGAIVSGLTALVVHRGSQVFAITMTLAIGLVAGNGLAPTVGAGWTVAPSQPPAGPLPSFELHTYREASATVDVHFTNLTGFVPAKAEAGPYGEGLFGHWCNSGPDTDAVWHVSMAEVGTIGNDRLRTLEMTFGQAPDADLTLDLPWITMQEVNPEGITTILWRAQGALLANDPAGGRVGFKLRPDIGGGDSTLEGEASWACGSWSSIER